MSAAGHTKRCPRCRVVKAIEDFFRNRSQLDGLQTYCKPCHSETSNARRANRSSRPLGAGTFDDFERAEHRRGRW